MDDGCSFASSQLQLHCLRPTFLATGCCNTFATTLVGEEYFNNVLIFVDICWHLDLDFSSSMFPTHLFVWQHAQPVMWQCVGIRFLAGWTSDCDQRRKAFGPNADAHLSHPQNIVGPLLDLDQKRNSSLHILGKPYFPSVQWHWSHRTQVTARPSEVQAQAHRLHPEAGKGWDIKTLWSQVLPEKVFKPLTIP